MSELFDLSGKVAVVVGGGTGLGIAYTESLTAAKASVVVADVDISVAVQTAEWLTQNGGRSIGLAIDLRAHDAVHAVRQAATDAFDRVDILVNCVAIDSDTAPRKLGDLTGDDWDSAINLPIRGALLCAQAMLEPMMQQRAGRIIHSLVAGPLITEGVYAVVHHALQGLTSGLAAELGPIGITVNALALRPTQPRPPSPPPNPSNRPTAAGVALPEDVAATLLLLCSGAGARINGQMITVHGDA